MSLEPVTIVIDEPLDVDEILMHHDAKIVLNLISHVPFSGSLRSVAQIQEQMLLCLVQHLSHHQQHQQYDLIHFRMHSNGQRPGLRVRL